MQKIHHQALHELAGAAQIIKSYEFLLEEYEEENHALRGIMKLAEELVNAPDSESFLAKKTKLLKALARFHAGQFDPSKWPIQADVKLQSSSRDNLLIS